MVHLATVKNDAELPTLSGGMENIQLDPPGEDEFSSSVYGSKFAAEDLPGYEMPEKEMPKEVAYRMIKDDLSLDGNPMLKYVRTKPSNGLSLTSIAAWPVSLRPTWYNPACPALPKSGSEGTDSCPGRGS